MGTGVGYAECGHMHASKPLSLTGEVGRCRLHSQHFTCRYRVRQTFSTRASSGPESGWDKKWRDTVNKAKQGVPKTDSQPVQSAPKFAKSSKRGEKVKEQESLLLDFWTQENTFKVGGAIVVGLLLAFVFIIGPP